MRLSTPQDVPSNIEKLKNLDDTADSQSSRDAVAIANFSLLFRFLLTNFSSFLSIFLYLIILS